MDKKKAYVVIYFDQNNKDGQVVAHPVGAYMTLEDGKKGMIDWILRSLLGKAYKKVQSTLFNQGICIPDSGTLSSYLW